MAAKPSAEDIARHYAAAHERLVALAGTLSDDQASTPAPGTPGWSVHDVLAHLAAITTDGLAGRIRGVPSDEFTAGQVADRRAATVAELVGEWSANVAPMCDGARAGVVPPNLAVDALTHEQDIRGALGLAPALSAEELRFCTSLYSYGCAMALRRAGLPALRLAATDTDFERIVGDGDPQAGVRAPEFELFRALSGRRSRSQVAAYDWEGGPGPYLEVVNVFGTLPDTDVRDA